MSRKKILKSTSVIELVEVTKKYKLKSYKPTLAEKIISYKKTQDFTALDNVSVAISKGEKVGIIGPNGAGKTTFLKIIAGIAVPTTGWVKTTGKLVSLIDLLAGFHLELTGRENIYLNGLIVGMTLAELEKKMNKIIKFADIGMFIDAPLYTYSTGMQLRLGFSIAVNSNPEILILDEGISAGDESFRKKAVAKIEQFFKQGKTILIASHWMEFLKNNCQRIILIEEGKITYDGDTSIINRYIRKSKRGKR